MIAHPSTRRGDTVVLPYTTAAGPLEATFDLPEGYEVDAGSDASVAAGWFPAMATGETLAVEEPVSRRLLAGTERIAEILLTWDRALHHERQWYQRVPMQAAPRPAESQRRPGGTMAFFTGGADSFYTAVRHRDELDALVFVHGFDLLDDRNDPLNQAVAARLREAAGMLGLPLLEVECNLVAFSRAFGIGWEDYHGAALATVALLLAPAFSRCYIPATATYDSLYPIGSHPLLDPLWGTERLEIIHDGADANRVEKLRRLADEPAARAHLRVCFENRGDRYNCGECEKCIRTGVAVRIAGVEGRFASLPSPSLRRIAAVDIPGLGLGWKEHRAELKRTGANERLRRAIEIAILRRRVRAVRRPRRGNR